MLDTWVEVTKREETNRVGHVLCLRRESPTLGVKPKTK